MMSLLKRALGIFEQESFHILIAHYASVASQSLLLTPYLPLGLPSPKIVLIGVSLSHFLTSYPIIYSIRHPKCQLILLALIHCMSAQSQKGEDRIDLYLADGLGMSHNKITKETKCES